MAKLSNWLLPARGRSSNGGGRPLGRAVGGAQSLGRTISSFASISSPWSSRASPSKQKQKVFIDGVTQVPVDVFEDMMEAGNQARMRGQHHFVHGGSTEDGEGRGRRPSLAISELQIDI